jgi:hypothetical protein
MNTTLTDNDQIDISEKDRLIEAEEILSFLSGGYWVSILNEADAPVNLKIGDRIMNYWKKFENS